MKTQTLSVADCYKILGVTRDANLEDVKHSYRKRAFDLHPDLNPGDGASRKFQQLNEAYVILIRLLGNATDNKKSSSDKNATKNGWQTYEDQARQDQERREAEEKERREKKERERQDRQEHEKRERERREKEDREQRDAERRERLKQEIERQENERLARQAQARHERERQVEARLAAEKAREEKLRQQAPKPESYRRNYARPQDRPGAASASSSRAASGQPQQESSSGQGGVAPGREELLHDLLNDPFARRVYEDIYSEVQHRKSASTDPVETPHAGKMTDIKGKSFPLNFSGGVGKAIKDWFRSQIDEDQELFFPASKMFPGARIRLQIRRGISGELRTVDITLPQDFAVGKPVRLKGMGRKFGRWQGDLYLTFQIKE